MERDDMTRVWMMHRWLVQMCSTALRTSECCRCCVVLARCSNHRLSFIVIRTIGALLVLSSYVQLLRLYNHLVCYWLPFSQYLD